MIDTDGPQSLGCGRGRRRLIIRLPSANTDVRGYIASALEETELHTAGGVTWRRRYCSMDVRSRCDLDR